MQVKPDRTSDNFGRVRSAVLRMGGRSYVHAEVRQVGYGLCSCAGSVDRTPESSAGTHLTPALGHRLQVEGSVVRACGVAVEALVRQVVEAGADRRTVNSPRQAPAILAAHITLAVIRWAGMQRPPTHRLARPDSRSKPGRMARKKAF